MLILFFCHEIVCMKPKDHFFFSRPRMKDHIGFVGLSCCDAFTPIVINF